LDGRVVKSTRQVFSLEEKMVSKVVW
jgi:hypothetical protein